MEIHDISDIRKAHRDVGGYFFEPSTMRFFRSRILNTVYNGPGGIYFVTSEQFEFRGDVHKRKYSVRRFDPEQPKSIDTVGEFQAYSDRRAAHNAARRLSEG